MMSKEILIPFRLNRDGTIATTESPDIQITQHVKSLISTNPGERVVIAGYGVPVRRFLFDAGNDTLNADIKTFVDQAMRDWEPNVYVQTITPIPFDDHTGISHIEVEYTKSAPSDFSSPATSYRAIVHVGGQVTEVTP